MCCYKLIWKRLGWGLTWWKLDKSGINNSFFKALSKSFFMWKSDGKVFLSTKTYCKYFYWLLFWLSAAKKLLCISDWWCKHRKVNLKALLLVLKLERKRKKRKSFWDFWARFFGYVSWKLLFHVVSLDELWSPDKKFLLVHILFYSCVLSSLVTAQFFFIYRWCRVKTNWK